MKEEVKNVWVAALRSGKYKQTTQKLCKDGGYCCLGVLSDISGTGEWKHQERFPSVYVTKSSNLQTVYPPDEVIEWAGMNSRDGRFSIVDLSTPNDKGTPFEKIAEIIEEYWEEL